jgi:hypothetical protein
MPQANLYAIVQNSATIATVNKETECHAPGLRPGYAHGSHHGCAVEVQLGHPLNLGGWIRRPASSALFTTSAATGADRIDPVGV